MLWKEHFHNVYNSVQDNGAKESSFTRIESSVADFPKAFDNVNY
jgi:hypothetical protein